MYSVKSATISLGKYMYLDLHFMSQTTFQIYKVLEENEAVYFYSHGEGL